MPKEKHVQMFLHDFERNTFDVIDYKKLEKTYIKALPIIYNIFLCWANDETDTATKYIDYLKKLCEDKHKLDKSRITKQRTLWYIEDTLPLVKTYLDNNIAGVEILLAHIFILNSYLDTKMQKKIYNYLLAGNRKTYENTYMKEIIAIYKKHALQMIKNNNE